MDEIRHVLPGYTVRPLKDFLSLMTSTNIPGLQTFINAMIALAVCIGLLVIFLSMVLLSRLRTRLKGRGVEALAWFYRPAKAS